MYLFFIYTQYSFFRNTLPFKLFVIRQPYINLQAVAYSLATNRNGIYGIHMQSGQINPHAYVTSGIGKIKGKKTEVFQLLDYSIENPILQPLK